MKRNLARFKVPREIEFIDELPRNATGKVLKRELKEPDEPDAGAAAQRGIKRASPGTGTARPRAEEKVWMPEW